MKYKVTQDVNEEAKKTVVDVDVKFYQAILEDDNKTLKDILFDIKNNDEVLLKDSKDNIERYKQCYLGYYKTKFYVILMNIKKNELVYFNVLEDNFDLVKCDDDFVNDKLLKEYNSLNSKDNKKVFNELVIKKINLSLAFSELEETYKTYDAIVFCKIIESQKANRKKRTDYLTQKKDFFNKLVTMSSFLVNLIETSDDYKKLDDAIKLIKDNYSSLSKNLKELKEE